MRPDEAAAIVFPDPPPRRRRSEPAAPSISASAATSESEVRTVGDAIIVTFPAEQVEVAFDRWRERAGTVSAEVTITTTAPGVAPLVHQATLSLTSTRARQDVARRCAARFSGPPWPDLLDRACVEALRRRRLGTPTVDLGLQHEIDMAPAYVLQGWVPVDGVTVFAADGGTGKSTLGLALAAHVALGKPFLGLPVRAGRVAFLDYETTWQQQARRLRLIARGMELTETPSVVYKHLDVPVPQCGPELRRFCDGEGIDFVLLDSLGFAGGAQPDAEPTLAVFRALNSLRRPVLVLHHANRQGEFYGSVYVRNAARSLIEVKKQQDAGSRVLHLGLFHAKANDTELQRPLGVQITFLPDATVISRTEIADVPELAEHLSITQRILIQLRTERQTPDELAEALGTTPATIRSKLYGPLRDKVLKLPDGTWGLAERRRSP